MLAVIIGLIFMIAGAWGILAWHADFMAVLRGLVPFMLTVGGAISMIAGITSISESYGEKPADAGPQEENKPK